MKKRTNSRPSYGAIIIATWILFFGIGIIFTLDFSLPREQIIFGATFSHSYAQYGLRLDWKKAFEAMLNELGFKELRLMTYWNETEKERGHFSFDDIDWMLERAHEKNIAVTLVVGKRQPRWPECHVPAWAAALPEEEEHKALLAYIETTVKRYKNNPAIKFWQVENEPLLTFFGECEPLNREFLKEEIKLVRNLDPAHPVMTTASGEFDSWREATTLTDFVGVSLYKVINKKVIGLIYYPLPPAFYRWRADFNQKTDRLFISELQGEPWTLHSIITVPHETYYEQMNAEKLREHVEFAVATGFDRIWLWGVEWWYWLKVERQKPELWEMARTLFP